MCVCVCSRYVHIYVCIDMCVPVYLSGMNACVHVVCNMCVCDVYMSGICMSLCV